MLLQNHGQGPVLDSNVEVATLFGDIERLVLHVLLDIIVIHLATDEPLGIKQGIHWQG